MKSENNKSTPGVALTVILSLLFIAGAVILVATAYYIIVYNVNFTALIFTVMSPLKGTDGGIISSALSVCLPIIIALSALYISVFLISRKKSSGAAGAKKYKVIKIICIILAPVMFAGSSVYAVIGLNIDDFISAKLHSTTIYEDRYVKPDGDIVKSDGTTKNLIYIYLESMETTYASKSDGGAQRNNYMEGMTALAKENLSFTDKEDGALGGFHNPTGTGWTMGALLATTSGVPFAFPVKQNSMSKREEFAPGLVTLGDVLEEAGYSEEFLCGSDSVFGGRKNYFTQHGDYKIFDLFTAREEGYIAPDYKVWWGFEDEILYKIAKDEISRLAKEDEPFNFTMLTVDTHHVGGYVCDLCTDEYGSVTANVVSCADRQLVSFVEWVKEQDFYEDTVIVITGDHPRMDTNLVKGIDYYDRTIYNCIINSDAAPQGATDGRVFTAFDMFPTVLEAMGFDVEGDRLGLGTSMFSALPTLAEEMGYDALDKEISKYSSYYLNNFAKQSNE